MAQVSEDPQVYKLLWLMRADFHVEQELDRLAKQGDEFALQQMMVAVDNPRLKNQALKELARSKPMSEKSERHFWSSDWAILRKRRLSRRHWPIRDTNHG